MRPRKPRLPVKNPLPYAWRTMWVIALFDLPTDTKVQKRAYVRFRKDLLNDGFTMMQYSVYRRHCASPENAQMHIQRMGKRVPSEGQVSFLTITDQQYSNIVSFFGKKREAQPPAPSQLEFF